jgi:lipopolysaccharide/colanic/teichoic acid biosynthesis glycosyltransferase
MNVPGLCKRAVDILLALLALALLWPLFCVIAILLLSVQGTPLLYRETRIGRRGRPFTLYKFRTMRPGANHVASVAPSNDPGITPAGKMLKPTRLDELPQLINVLRGNMSLVGPRPLSPKHLATLPPATVELLLTVPPGITGPASLTFLAEDDVLAGVGDPERIYLEVLLPAKVDIQLEYIRHWSLARDLAIIYGTLSSVWSGSAWERSRQVVASLIAA